MRRAGYLLHPSLLFALVLWLMNDHIFKAAFPGWWTGKLSDVAGLAVFPLIPVAALDLQRARRGQPPPPMALLIVCIIATAVAFTAMKTVAVAADLYRYGLGSLQWPFLALRSGSFPAITPVHLTEDVSDVLTLPALWLPWRVAARHLRVPELGKLVVG